MVMGTIWHSLLAQVRYVISSMNKGFHSPVFLGVSHPSVSHPGLYLSFPHTNKLTSGWIHICKDIKQFYGFTSPLNGLGQTCFQCMHYEHVTYHGAFSDLAVVLSAVQDKNLKKISM